MSDTITIDPLVQELIAKHRKEKQEINSLLTGILAADTMDDADTKVLAKYVLLELIRVTHIPHSGGKCNLERTFEDILPVLRMTTRLINPYFYKLCQSSIKILEEGLT